MCNTPLFVAQTANSVARQKAGYAVVWCVVESRDCSFSVRNSMVKFQLSPLNRDAECRWGMKKSRMANICLSSKTTQDRAIVNMVYANRNFVRSIEWCRFQ